MKSAKILAIFLSLFLGMSNIIYAQDTFSAINNANKTLKKGNYTYKIDFVDYNFILKVYNKNNKLVISLPKVYYALAGDKGFYYSTNNYNTSNTDIIYTNLTDNSSKILYSKKSNSPGFLNAIKDDYLYFQISEGEVAEATISPVYKLNLKTGKTSKIIEDAGEIHLSDNKIFYKKTSRNKETDTLYSSDLNGKNIKVVEKFANTLTVENNKLYYAAKKSDGSYCIYEMSEDLSGKKQISKPFYCTHILSITSKSAKYTVKENEVEETYKMDFASGKITKIN